MSQCLKKQDNVRKISEVEFVGLLDPLRAENTVHGFAPQGATVYQIIEEACKANKIHKRHMKFGVAQIGRRDPEKNVIIWKPVHIQAWKKRRVREGDLVRFRLLPRGGGGGGGKNPLRTILQLAVTVVAVIATSFVPTLFPTLGTVGLAFAKGAVGLAVMSIGTLLTNAIAPVRNSGKSLSSARQESPTYEISAAKNSINAWGRVPAPLGRGRFAPPYAALPYTVVQNDDQYAHALFCIGIGDVNISDIRIGDTNISEFVDVSYEYYKYDPNNPKKSSLFPTGIVQEDLNVELLYNQFNTRTTTLCDKANVDIQFQGIGYANNSGGIDNVCVDFEIQYKAYDKEEWASQGNSKWVGEYRVPFINGYSDVGISYDKGYKTFPSSQYGEVCTANGYTFLCKLKSSSYIKEYGCRDGDCSHCTQKEVEIVNTNRKNIDSQSISGFGVNIESGRAGGSFSRGCRDVWAKISGGWIAKKVKGQGTQIVTICGARNNTLRRTFEIMFPEKGKYDIRVRRMTADSTDARRNDRSFWVAIRSISNDNPINTPYPVNLLAVKMKASGQLSGAIDTLSVYYETDVLDWDKVSGEWVKRYTSNPASLFRHILQDKVGMARPQSDNIMDFDSIVDAHEFWEEKGWGFNLVCDSDRSVFERLQDFCAAGLASPTMIDGKWGIIVDKPRDYIACAFTESNSWNWTFSKTQALMPNEIHCNFISEDNWEQTMRIVPTDEPMRDNYLFETQDFTGVTNAEQIFQLARFHYADAKVRKRFISLRAYDEALLCTRGDLVACSCPSVYPYGLQNGRIRTIFLDEEDRVVQIETTQAQATDFSGRRFGIQIFNDDGDNIQVEILPENKESTMLKLKNPQKLPIQLGNKYAFGDFKEETFQAIVLGMKFNSDMTCDIELQDYVPLMYGSLDEPIPDWKNPVTSPVDISCTELKAYEIWQYDSTSKSGRSYIQVSWNGDAKNWNVFVSVNDDTPKLHGSTNTNTYTIDPVDILKKYTIYVTPKNHATGANKVDVYTLGKQAPPSPVLVLNGTFYKDTIHLFWEHIPDHDKQGYELRQGAKWELSNLIASNIADNTYDWQPPADGTYKFLLKSIDTFGNYSNEAAECIMTVDVEQGLNIVASFEELPNYVDEAEEIYNFVPVEDKIALVWTPSATNKHVAQFTNKYEWLKNYSGNSDNGVYVSKVHDLGIVSSAYLRIVVDYETYFTSLITNKTFRYRTNKTFPYDTNRHITTENKLKVEYRLSNDNVEWTDWIPFLGLITVESRYYQARVMTQNESPYIFTKIKRIGILVDVPDRIMLLKEQVIPIDGKEYSLQEIGVYPIYVGYIVGITVLGESGKYAVIDKFTDKFIVKCYDNSGKVGSVVDLEIRGV